MGKHILLTGSIRSGSTWTGRVISQSSRIRYVIEPFNFTIKRHQPIFDNWYECLVDRPVLEQEKAKAYLTSFYSITDRRIYKNNLNLSVFEYSNKLIREIRSRIIRRTLYKDPLAIMSAEWIYREFNWNIIVMIRHPAAFVASIKVKNWPFNVENFLRQENLLSLYFQDYENEIRRYKKNPPDIIDNSILLWNCIYNTVVNYQKKYGNAWYFVKHEDLSRNPEEEFKKLFAFLNLTFDDNVNDYLNNTTKSSKVEELKRDSLQNIKTWKDRLTLEEIHRVKEGTKKVWTNFYTENDW